MFRRSPIRGAARPSMPGSGEIPVPFLQTRSLPAGGVLVPLLLSQGLAFGALWASGKMPVLVLRVFRALLTL